MFLGFKQTSQNLSVLTCSLSLLSYTGSELEQILISWQTEDFKYENKTIGNLLVLELKKKKTLIPEKILKCGASMLVTLWYENSYTSSLTAEKIKNPDQFTKKNGISILQNLQ